MHHLYGDDDLAIKLLVIKKLLFIMLFFYIYKVISFIY